MLRKWRSGAGLIFSFGLILAVVGAGVFLSAPTMLAIGQPQKICHGTNSDTNPYVENPPDIASIIKDEGHGSHIGPIWALGMKDAKITWGDIIPPFDYETGTSGDKHDGHYPGMNWTTAGQAIFNNGCNIPLKNVNVSTIVFNAATNAAWAGTEQTGASAYDTSRVVAPSAIPVPTGTVTYSFYTNNACTGDGSSAGTKTLTASGTVPISDTKSSLAAGSYAFRATYNGDSHYNSKTSDCEPFTVAEGPYDPSTTTTTVVFNAATNAALVGNLPVNGSAYDTSTVAHVGGGTPTGTISYTFYTNNTCSGDGTSAGSDLALGTKSSTKGPLAAGDYSFKAAYTSDNLTNFNSSTSVCEPFKVSPAQLIPTPSPTGGVLAATGATPPTQDLAISLIALGLLAMMGGAFAWRRREA